MAKENHGVILPSWSDTTTKKTIINFVNRVNTENTSDYVPPGERIAVFDNDGTLWSEKPFYFQAFFLIDRLKAMAVDHPQWHDTQPYKAILEGDKQAISRLTEKDIIQMLAVTHTGMTVEQFQLIAGSWLKTAKHPRFNRLFTECVFQPMLELLDYLRDNGFKTYIVSGGGVEFVRAFAQEVYGIPPEQVIGSSVKTKFALRDGKFVLVKVPELGSVDDKEGKPVNINLHIGRKPLLAFGNSDGDLAMLQYTSTRDKANLMLLLHHDDGEREWAYDRESKIGRLDKAWDEARQKGWTIVSMQKDFQRVYPFDP
ncbi:MAG: hypothetical protein N5P05_001007 [Chroococcopsis gigantea SAG 12.99]|jgi:phosphoglycolate phosphatase-like HAD superfamily hydrolase|nr:haloacid dehalogenase-like hydrolase [Chlorogloea purpurea SAG 13.99]MDV2999401.1 hypothetical protein [Chroococcopsis gigantea SAG 12.99]